MKFLFLLIAALTFKAWSQDADIQFLETQKSISSPFSIPVTVNEKGEFKILSTEGNQLSIGPLGQFNFSRSKVQYIVPIKQGHFTFQEQDKGLSWVEIKRHRVEIGLGIRGALPKFGLSAGLIPYKGSLQVMMREKPSKETDTPKPSLPKELADVKNWGVGDQGSFQTYGGIQAYVGVGFSYVTIADASYVIQNQFLVGIRKISDEQILLSIGEESLNRRQLSSGVRVLSASLSWNNGKLLTTQFLLNMNDPVHQGLYKKALDGKITVLQETLPSTLQKMDWKGSERDWYIGIPWTVGRSKRIGHYEVNDNGEEEVLDMQLRRNHGKLLPFRYHKKLVYQTDKNIVLFWVSEMNKTHTPALKRNFLSYGHAMGIEGFDAELPEQSNFGSTVTHLGVSFTRFEVESMATMDIDELTKNLKARCELMELKCAKKKKLNSILKDFRKYITLSWDNARQDLGKLLVKQPALIHALVKTMGVQKKVYFKFLSEKFQSIEGTGELKY